MSSVRAELKYVGKLGIEAAKEVLGLPRRGYRTFFIDRFSRLLKSGAIGRNCRIIALGKNDGVGSQALASMSALCFARAHGLQYVHRPFTFIEHAEGDMQAAVRMWESHFNLGAGELRIDENNFPVVPIDEFMLSPDRWQDDIAVSAPHYLHFCNRDRTAWERVAPLLRARYRAQSTRSDNKPFTVAVHVRKAVSPLDPQNKVRNLTSNASFVETIKTMQEVFRAKRKAVQIRIFSQGQPQDFIEFSNHGCELCLDAPALSTHQQLIDADVLVMSRSAFSYTAALLNDGICFYDPQKERPLQNWILRSRSGSFDQKELSDRLDSLLLAGYRRN